MMRNELAVRASNVGLDPTTYANDSKLEQKVLWLEKRGTTFAGTLATGTLTSNNTNNSDGDVVVIGNYSYTFRTNLTGAVATTTLTSTGTTPTDGDSISIEGQTYVFRTTLTNSGTAPYEVYINGSAANALTNLKAAINASGTPATTYGTGTFIHPLVTATTLGSTTLVINSKLRSTVGNNYATTVITGSTYSFTGAYMAGGANRVAGEVHISTTADLSLTNLVSAIGGGATADTDYDASTPVNLQVTAAAVSSHASVMTAVDYNYTNAGIASTTTSTTLSWGGAIFASGVRKTVAANTTTYSGEAGLSGDANV